MPKVKKLKIRNKTPVSQKKSKDDGSPIEARAISASRATEETKSQINEPNDDMQLPDVSADGGVSDISNLGKQKKGKKDAMAVAPFNSKIRETRDKTMYRDNWNYFVGDNDFKTDMFLRFQEKHTKYQYHKFLLASSAYSVRILLVLTTMLNIYLTSTNSEGLNFDGLKSYSLQIGMLGAAVFASSPKFSATIQKQEPIYSNIVINLVPLLFGKQTLNLYQVQRDNYLQGQDLVNQFKDQNETSELFSKLIELNNFDSDSRITKSLSDTQLVSKSQMMNMSLYLIVFLHNLPFFLILIQVCPDWLEYSLFVGVSNILYLSQSPLDQKDFLFRSLVAHALLVFLFALNEKIRKELFVISITNSRTKKQLMRVFNQIAPSAIVSRDGAIVMCNEKFEKLVTEQIGAKSFPSNFLKMIQNDEQAKNQMSDAIHNTISKGQETKEFELIVRKDKSKIRQDQDEEDKEHEESVYNDYRSAFRVTVSQVQYKQSKHCLINLECITDLKGKYRLMSLHTRHIGQSVITAQRRMEILHRQLLTQGLTDLSHQVGQFLGSSQVTFNMIQQMSHYLKFTSDMDDYKIETYVLSEEIDFCLDGLTASKWEKEIEVFLTKGHLPKQVLGDLRKFRICMRTLLEFGIKYSCDNQMYVKCEFKEFTPEPERHFVIQFSLEVARSSVYNLEPIRILLEEQVDELDENEDLSFDKQIRKNYPEFMKHIKEFGYGMIAFPSVVKQLKGTYFFANGEEDDNGSISNTTLPKDKIKIGFKCPFEPAVSSNVIQKTSYKINPSFKEMMDGTQIFKTPQIKSAGREVQRANIHGVSAALGSSNPGHAAPSPANPNLSGNATRGGSLVSGAVLQNASFGSNIPANGYASVNNNKASGVVGSTDQPRGRSVPPQTRQGYSTTGNESRAPAENNASSGQDQILSSQNGNPTAMASQPPVISAIDNSFKNMQNLQNTNSGEGSQKQQDSSNGNISFNNNSQNFDKKRKAVIPARNALLKNAFQEGPPRQFFGQGKDKNEYKSTSTADFIAGKPKEGESSQGTNDKVGGSFGFNIGSKQKIESKEDFDKKQFSFMEGGKQGANTAQQIHKGDQAVSSKDTSVQVTTQSIKLGGPIGSVRSNNEPSFRSKIVADIKDLKSQKNNQLETSGIKSANDGEGISVPQSAKMEGEIVGKSESRNDDFDSEIKDRVDSLQNQILDHKNEPKAAVISEENVGDLDDDKPYNFNMEKYDSFMIDSEDGGLGLSYGSSKLKKAEQKPVKKNPMDVIHDMFRSKPTAQKAPEKSQTLSKKVRREIFDRFADTPGGASRNLLSQGSIPEILSTDQNKNSSDIQTNEAVPKEAAKSEQKPQTPKEKVELNKFSGHPKAAKKSENIFMQAALVGAGVHTFNKAKHFDKNLLNLNSQGKEQVLKYETKQKSKDYIQDKQKIQQNIEQTMIKIQIKRAHSQQSSDRRLLNVWQRNILMHPQATNAEYDAMDRNKTLKTFNTILEDIENQVKQQWLKPTVASPQINTVSRQNDSLASAIKPKQILVGIGKQEETPSTSDEPKGKQIMLVVEDNQFIQMAIQQQITSLGVDFESCLNGQEAVDIVEKFLKEGKMFDVILMDLIMPVMNGFKASAEIRELEKKYNIPVAQKLFICGYSSQVGLDTEIKCFDNGMDDIVAKPMNTKALQRMLSENDRRKIIGSSNNPSSVQQHVSPISESRQTPIPRPQKDSGYNTAQQPKSDQAAVQVADSGRK